MFLLSVISVALAQTSRREATFQALSRMRELIFVEASLGLANPHLLPLSSLSTDNHPQLFGFPFPAPHLHAMQHIMDASVFIDGVASGRRDSVVWHADTEAPNPVAERILDEWTRAAIQTINARQFPEARTLIGQALHMVQDRSEQSVDAAVTFLTSIRNATIDLFPHVLGMRGNTLGNDLIIVLDTTYQDATEARLVMLLNRLPILNNTLPKRPAGFALYTFDRVNPVPKSYPYQTTVRGFTDLLTNLMTACTAKRDICVDTDISQTNSPRRALEAVSLAARNADSSTTIILLTDAPPVVTDSAAAPRVVSAILESKQQRLVVIGVNDLTKQADYARIVERTGGSFISLSNLPGQWDAGEVFQYAVRDDLALVAVVDSSRDASEEILIPLYDTDKPAGIWIGNAAVRICDGNDDQSCREHEPGTWVTANAAITTEWRFTVKQRNPAAPETWSVRAYISTPSCAQLGLYHLDPFARDRPEYQRVENDPLVGVNYTIMTLGSINATLSLVTITGEVIPTSSSQSNNLQAQADITVPPGLFRIKVTQTVNGTAYHRFTDIIRPSRANITFQFSRPVEVQVPGGKTRVRSTFLGDKAGRFTAVDNLGYVSESDIGCFNSSITYPNGETNNITVPLSANSSVNYMVFGVGNDRLDEDAGLGNHVVRPMVLIPGVPPTPPQCTINSSTYDNCPKGPLCVQGTWDARLVFTDDYAGFLDVTVRLKENLQAGAYAPQSIASSATSYLMTVNETNVFIANLRNYPCCLGFRFTLYVEWEETGGACEFGWIHPTTTTDTPQTEEGLSSETIAGIVVGVLAGVALLAAIAICLKRRS